MLLWVGTPKEQKTVQTRYFPRFSTNYLLEMMRCTGGVESKSM